MKQADIRSGALDLMATRPGPWFAIDMYEEIGCKWLDLWLALHVLEESGKVRSSKIPTNNPDYPARRGWELVA